MPRIDNAINQLHEAARLDAEEGCAAELKAAAIAMCESDGLDPNALVMGSRTMVLQRFRDDMVVVNQPIQLGWMHYICLAAAALRAAEEESYHAKNR